MSRRYVSPAASRMFAVGQIPYHIVRDNKEAESANADQQRGARLEHRRPDQEGEPGWASLRAASPGRQQEQSELTQAAFDKLLALLDQDRDAAGRKYEIIRRKLEKFFECRGCPNPDDLADETINLVARKVDQGQQITGDEPVRYFYGVARNIIRDYWRRSARRLQSTECLPQSYHPSEDPTETAQRKLEGHMSDRRLEELERCLRELTKDNRELIIKYYEYDGRAKKAGRTMLARQMGIQSNTLRLRVHRIRLKLRRHFGEPKE